MAGVYTPGEPVIQPGAQTGLELIPADLGQVAGAGNATGALPAGALGFGTQLIAAAGTTQGSATAIVNAGMVIITTCTASSEGIKLPAATTGKRVFVMSAATQGTKIYPGTNARIGTSATNVAVVQTGLKGELYVASSTTRWWVLKGA